MPSLPATEAAMPHSIILRGREKRLADTVPALSIEEMGVVASAIRKLEKVRLIVTRLAGRKKTGHDQ